MRGGGGLAKWVISLLDGKHLEAVEGRSQVLKLVNHLAWIVEQGKGSNWKFYVNKINLCVLHKMKLHLHVVG